MVISRGALVVLCAVAAAAVGCHSPKGIQHPIASLLARPANPTGRISLEKPVSTSTAFAREMERLLVDSSAISLGALESPTSQVFGEVTTVGTDGDGRVYILDAKASEVRIFGRDGQFLETVGRPGHGPGEFVHAQSLMVDSSGQLFVGDTKRHLHVFDRGPDGMRFSRVMDIPVSAQDMCLIGDRLFVHGLAREDNHVIHELDRSGHLIHSFGTVYHSKNPVVTEFISTGRLACDEAAGLVLFAPMGGVGEVHGYALDGTLVWLTVIDDFRPITITEVPRGFGVVRPENGFHLVRALTPLSGGRILLQISFSTRASYEEGFTYLKLQTYLLDVHSGEGSYLGDSFPAVISSRSTSTVSIEEDPYPRLRIQLSAH